MRIPKPSPDSRGVPWVVTALLVLLLVLVPVLAWFQYQWTGEASRAEVFRMRANLRTTLLHWSVDFQRSTTLSDDPGLPPEPRFQLESDEQALARGGQLLFNWELRDENPGLVAGVWVIGEKKAWLSAPDGTHWEGPLSPIIVPDNPFRVTLGLSRNPQRRMLVELNPQVLLKTVIPSLVEKYFSGPEGLPDYRVAVREAATGKVLWASDGKTESPELSSSAPEASLNLLGSGDRFGPVLPDPPALDSGFGLFTRVLRPLTDPVWTLEVRHVDGSLEAAAERVRWLNLSGTFTLLSVLTFGFLFLYRLYNRNRLAVRAQQDFVSSVSHELKSPLAVLRAAAENLKEGVVSEPGQARRYGERMLSEADRLLALTENILRYSGLEAQPWNPDGQAPVDLALLIRARIEAWKENFQQKGVLLEASGSPPGRVLVGGREVDLAAIVDNLLSNALKHGTTGASPPRVAVEWGELESSGVRMAAVAVLDNGKGLPAREQKKVFEPFYRSRGTTVSGVGLGLSLVARLVNAHGGKIELKSSPGAGAKFTVLLPLFRAVPNSGDPAT